MQVSPDFQTPVDTLLHVADLHFWKLEWNPFRLANKRFLGNLHVALSRRKAFDMRRAEPAADALAALGIPNVVMTGDFTSSASDAEFVLARTFIAGLQQRGMDVTLLPGNHDVYTFESVRKARFERHFPDHPTLGGLVAQRTLPGATALLLVPTVCANWLSSAGRVTPATLAELERQLAACDDFALVAGHYPILARTHAYLSPPSHQLRNREALRETLAASGKRILYLCGHVHRFSYVQDAQHANLSQLSTETLFRTDRLTGSHGGFSEIHVLPEGLRVFRHRLAGDWMREEMQPHHAAPR